MTPELEIQQMITKFAVASYKHQEAIMEGNSRKANRHAKQIAETFQKIVTTGELARKALLQLTQSEDDAVAAMAATFSLKYATDEAIAVLKRIAKRPDLLGFRSEQAIKRWEEGTWQLE